MRTIDPGLAAHLAVRVTTLATCWRVTRADGGVLGFTDHDRTLSFDGTDYEPATGFDGSQAAGELGFAPGGMDVSGALSSDRLCEDDLAAGLYDGAAVAVWLVNWQAPDERHLLRTGFLGEVTRSDGAFKAEIRGLAALLDQTSGRAFRHGCDADLGDARCGVDLTAAGHRGEGIVTTVAGRRRFLASGLSAFASGWFERGRLSWTSGANAGRAVELRAHRLSGASALVELWQPAHHDIAVGDAFTLTAGCDKLFATCREKFANGVNFRGFPHMPGNDFALSYVRKGGDNSGAALVE